MYYISQNLNSNKLDTEYPIDKIALKHNNYSDINSEFQTFIKNINAISQINNISFGILSCNLIEKKTKILIDYLSKKELELYSKYKSQKRQIQFIGARILSKILIHKASNRVTEKIKSTKLKENFKQISITKDKNNGVPTICMDKKEKINISISHSNNYIFSAISKNKLGIDVQEINSRLVNLKKAYTKEKEENIINTTLDYAYIWASKEAITKYLQTSILQTIKNTTLENRNNNIFTFSHKKHKGNIKTHNFNYNGYVFALAFCDEALL